MVFDPTAGSRSSSSSGRHPSVRIHRQIGRFAVFAERAADIDALVRQAELADRHITFCTFDEVFRPQILIIYFVLLDQCNLQPLPACGERSSEGG